jgi:hypothetical protein
MLDTPVAHPLAAHTGAAREPDATVHHQDPAVIAVVCPTEERLRERPEVGHVAAGALHEVGVLGGHSQRAEGVEKDVDTHTVSAALGERFGDVAGDRTVLVIVLGIRDGALPGVDRLHHTREDLLAVQQKLDRIAAHDRRHRIRFESRKERRLSE